MQHITSANLQQQMYNLFTNHARCESHLELQIFYK